jgi:hypothetical protein
MGLSLRKGKQRESTTGLLTRGRMSQSHKRPKRKRPYLIHSPKRVLAPPRKESYEMPSIYTVCYKHIHTY